MPRLSSFTNFRHETRCKR